MKQEEKVGDFFIKLNIFFLYKITMIIINDDNDELIKIIITTTNEYWMNNY